jgi:Fe-S cluster assembly protein SufD
MLKTTQEKFLYLTAFEEFERTIADWDTPWLRPIRNAAIARFGELGFPGRKNEDWKFTSLTSLAKVPFKLATERQEVSTDIILPHVFDGAYQLVFVNNRYRSDLSKIGDLPAGLVLTNLADAIQVHGELVEPHLARYAEHDGLALTALNTAFLYDGAFVYLKPATVVEKPIHIIHVSTSPGEPTMCFPRHLVVAGRNSQVTVVESYVGIDEEVYFTNAVVEICADEDAHVDHYKVVRESNRAFHIANLQVEQKGRSNVFSHYIALSGGLIRNESRTRFDGEHSECTFNGLYLGRDKQHIDSHTVIDHAQANCHSYELYKGLLDDKSRGVFNGKIFVRPDAQKTDAKQTNQCILLSDDATIDTKPLLEIFADDVKCTLGATVGQLDETALFYLRSRGIDLDQARSLLVYAFANDIVERIKVEPIRHQLQDFLLTRQSLPIYQET